MPRESCTKCRTVPADILVLECEHSLCIRCASRCCLVETATIVCPSCRSVTYLDEDIVGEICEVSVRMQGEEVRRNGMFLEAEAKGRDGERKENWYRMSNKENDITSSSNFNSSDLSSKSKTNKKPDQAKDLRKTIKQPKSCFESTQKYSSNHSSSPLCKQHPQYQIMYLCLQCHSNLLCPQCVIHGQHKNHKVETVKRTIAKIQAELSSKIYSLDCSIQGLVQASEDKKRRLKGKIEQIKRLEMEAVGKYRAMREEIAREEAEIMAKCAELIECFESDFFQVQKWIKNDLLTIQKQRDSISHILNPIAQSIMKKEPKPNQKFLEIKIVEEYLAHLKRNDRSQDNKYLWLNNKEIGEGLPESQQGLEMLTDRIQRIRFVPSHLGINLNQVQTRNHSLAASRSVGVNQGSKLANSGENRSATGNKYVESPFNTLKISFQKQNQAIETESILVKGSHMKQSRKSKKKSLRSEQSNYLIF